MKIYGILTSVVLGAFVIVFLYQAVTIYQLRTKVNDDRILLTQVVTFLNSQIQTSQQGAQPAKASTVTKK